MRDVATSSCCSLGAPQGALPHAGLFQPLKRNITTKMHVKRHLFLEPEHWASLASCLQRAVCPLGWAGEALLLCQQLCPCRVAHFLGGGRVSATICGWETLKKTFPHPHRTPTRPSLPSVSRGCTRRAPTPAARARGRLRSPQNVQAPPNARALFHPPRHGEALRWRAAS